MESRPDPARAELTQEDVASVVASLEPGQLAFAKAQSHCPRRRLTKAELLFFWALRIYLLFMFGVVLYQVWTVAR